MADLSHVRSGDPVQADRWNDLLDAVRQAMRVGGADAFIDANGAHFRARPAPANPAVIVQISSAAAGGGQYNARILTGISTADGAGDLAMPEGLHVPDADDALYLDLTEDATAAHALPDGCWRIGLVVGTADGKTIVAGDRNPSLLDELADVTAPTPATGDLLQFDGDTWQNATADDIAADWVEVTVITDLRVDGTSLQCKTRTIRVPAAGVTSDWITWHEGTTCA